MGLIERLGRLRGDKIRVTMTKSVDDHVAGFKYDLNAELADRYILRGYATGTTSRAYAEHEIHAMTANSQTVGV